MASVKECVAKALETLNILRNKQQQEVAMEEIILGRDALAVLPTGFGKRMIFKIFVLARQEMLKRLEKDDATCVLIISSLASIISDQIAEMQTLDFNALELSKETLTEVHAGQNGEKNANLSVLASSGLTLINVPCNPFVTPGSHRNIFKMAANLSVHTEKRMLCYSVQQH